MATIRIFKHYLHLPYVFLAAIESVILIFSVYAGAHLRFFYDPSLIFPSIGLLMPRAIVFAAIMLLSMASMGVYQSRLREGITGMMLRTVVAMFFLGAIALSLLMYLFPALDIDLGRGVFVLASVIAIVLIAILRFIFDRLIDDNLFKRRILVLGAGAMAYNLTEKLKGKMKQKGFSIIGYVPQQDEYIYVDTSLCLRLHDSMADAAKRLEIEEIIIAIDDDMNNRNSLPLDQLMECKLSGVDVLESLTFMEREIGKVELDLLHPAWIVFSDGFTQSRLRDSISRFFDIVVSAGLLLVTWPFMLATIIAIKIEEGISAPVLYRQSRVGLNGQLFNVLKFRSMRLDAEKDGVARWAKKEDNRVTQVGKFIRKTRIDELPQIVNVFRGDMSFVGPRPERPEFVKQLKDKIPYYDERHRVKPGITGWAQLKYPYGASEKDALEKLKYDMYYVKNHSLLLDLLIIIQTVEVVLVGDGAR